MKALVLGGSQFVGLHTVRELVARGWEVTVLNRGKTATQLPTGVARLRADRTDPESMKNALEGKDWDAVFDTSGFLMAAMGASMPALIDLLDGHVGTYVYTSSIMVYEPCGLFPWRESFSLVEEGPNTYGGFKKAMETALLERHDRSGFPACIVPPRRHLRTGQQHLRHGDGLLHPAAAVGCRSSCRTTGSSRAPTVTSTICVV